MWENYLVQRPTSKPKSTCTIHHFKTSERDANPIDDNSQYAKSTNIMSQKQKYGGLTHISDDILEFFAKLEHKYSLDRVDITPKMFEHKWQ